MEIIDLYNLEQSEIEFLISKSAIDSAFKSELYDDAKRLKFNLSSLLQSFPSTNNERKTELKQTIDSLTFLLQKIN